MLHATSEHCWGGRAGTMLHTTSELCSGGKGRGTLTLRRLVPPAMSCRR